MAQKYSCLHCVGVILLTQIDFKEKCSISCGHTFGSAAFTRAEGGWLSCRGEPFGQPLCAGEDGVLLHRKYICIPRLVGLAPLNTL